MVTLKDIAAEVGISVAATSLALRDHRSISLETKQRVWGVKEKLGYVPAPRKPRTVKPTKGMNNLDGHIAFVLVERQFSDFSYSAALQGITEAAAASSLKPIALSLKLDDIRNGILPPLLKNREVEGIVVGGLYDEEAHRQLRRLNLPVIVFGNFQLGDEPWASCEVDLLMGMRLIVKRLASLGHRNSALILRSAETEYGAELEHAFVRSLAKSGMAHAGLLIQENTQDLRGDVAALLRQPSRPTAFILPNDETAPAVYDACEDAGLKIPRDVSVAAFSVGGYVMRPSLCTVETDMTVMSLGAVKKLAQLIRNPQSEMTREIFKMSLIPGGSFGPAPGLEIKKRRPAA